MLMMTRREALKATALATATMTCATLLPTAIAQSNGPVIPPASAPPLYPPGPFTLPILPYDYDALEPFIDSATMHVHHDQIHQAYVNNLNAAVAGHLELGGQTVKQLLKNLAALPEAIRPAVQVNGGGHYHHSLFWQMMRPDGGGEPAGQLMAAINGRFKNFDGFKAEFKASALARSGNGWTWLLLGGDNQLAIESTADEDSPVSAGKEILLGLDVWEHAYNLKYQNRRADYIDAWFNVVNWYFAAQRLQSPGE